MFVSVPQGACGPNVSVTYEGRISTNASTYHWSFKVGATTKTSSKSNGTISIPIGTKSSGQVTTVKVTLTVTNASGTDSDIQNFTTQCT